MSRLFTPGRMHGLSTCEPYRRQAKPFVATPPLFYQHNYGHLGLRCLISCAGERCLEF